MFRSIVRLGEARANVAPALKKLWKKHYPVNGQVTQHLSPFEQKAVAPMFKDAPLKILKKVADFLKEAGPALAIGIMVYLWSEKKHKEIAFHHRS